MDKHAPLVTKEVIIRPNTPWFTDSITAAKRLRRQAERRWYSSKLTIHLEIYKDACRNVDRICRTATSAYYQAEIEEHINNPKALFRITDSLMNKPKVTTLPKHGDPKVLANDFVSFFSETIRIITESFPNTVVADDPINALDGVMQTAMEALAPATETEVRKIILSGNSKCCDLDPIPTRLL